MDKQTLNSLLVLGLTHKEAQAYHQLIGGGVMTAEDVSKLIKVQHAVIYRTLEGLKSKGWVESTSDRPKKYRAIPPKTAVQMAAKQAIRVIEDAAQAAEAILLAEYKEDFEMQRQEIWTIRGFENVIKKIGEIGARTTTNLVVKITGPIDDSTFSHIFGSVPGSFPISAQVMGPPIIVMGEQLKARVSMKHPAFKKECKNLAPIMGMGGESKDEFLKTVHGSRFISMHLLFDSREALWINIPYRNNEVVSDKVWANWISDPEYMDIMREEDG